MYKIGIQSFSRDLGCRRGVGTSCGACGRCHPRCRQARFTLCCLQLKVLLPPCTALRRAGDRGYYTDTSFPNKSRPYALWFGFAFFFSSPFSSSSSSYSPFSGALVCEEDGGESCIPRALPVSLWRGLPPYNGIKFKFKCGRDVKSTARKE